MQTNHRSEDKQIATLGAQGARLLTALRRKRRTIFSVNDVQKVTGAGLTPTRKFVGKLVQRGLATRLKRDLFVLVRFELERGREYLGSPCVVARELAGGREYYLSYASAMAMHNMTNQPPLVVHVTSPHTFRDRTILGTEFHFTRCNPELLFGINEHRIDNTEKVAVSDLERTIIDGLRQPGYCGGFSQVAKGFCIRRADVNVGRLVDYALRLDVGAVIRRLGFLLETSAVAAPADLQRLRGQLTTTYHLLDPNLPAKGRRVARWRLRLNVNSEELEAARST